MLVSRGIQTLALLCAHHLVRVSMYYSTPVPAPSALMRTYTLQSTQHISLYTLALHLLSSSGAFTKSPTHRLAWSALWSLVCTTRANWPTHAFIPTHPSRLFSISCTGPIAHQHTTRANTKAHQKITLNSKALPSLSRASSVFPQLHLFYSHTKHVAPQSALSKKPLTANSVAATTP